MRLCPGVLMVPVRGCGMGEQTTGRHQGQCHVDPGDTECDTGQGSIEGPSSHSGMLLRYVVIYALHGSLSTDGCSRLLQKMYPRTVRGETPAAQGGARHAVRSPSACTTSNRAARAWPNSPLSTYARSAA